MAAPTIGSFLRPGKRPMWHDIANIAGLASLAAPTADKLQASYRARKAGVDPESKMLMGHKAHALAELAGYGALSAPVIHNLRSGQVPLHSAAQTLGGYGVLSAPVVGDLTTPEGEEKSRVLRGPTRTLAELGGLGLLAGGTLTAGH